MPQKFFSSISNAQWHGRTFPLKIKFCHWWCMIIFLKAPWTTNPTQLRCVLATRSQPRPCVIPTGSHPFSLAERNLPCQHDESEKRKQIRRLQCPMMGSSEGAPFMQKKAHHKGMDGWVRAARGKNRRSFCEKESGRLQKVFCGGNGIWVYLAVCVWYSSFRCAQ